MTEIASIISAIVKMGAKVTWDKAKRRESVIKLLKRFNFDPNTPPTDIDGIFIYTLIEYGIDRPEPILNFFRNKYVKEAFQQSFYKNDPSILDNEAEGIIEWNEETGKLGYIDYDPRREFAAFSTVFHAIIDRTRTPAEVKRDQKLDGIRVDIHDSSTEIIKRLDALADLDRVRDERDRLIQISPLSSLSKQMRDWFKTLNYSFENHDVKGDGYFEWIINVPARRGYDRVLVRGIEGEGEISDVENLRKAVEIHHTKEGWLVVVRRISQAASNLVKKPEYQDIYCYTFDELLDENADFSRYLDWLEEEIKRRGIDKLYVPLACTKEDFDLVTKQKFGESCYNQNNGWIDGYIDRWLDDTSKEHISILGEFGTGKTWFGMHYAWTLLQRYRDAKARGIERPRLPLVISLRDYAKAVSVESLFSEFFFRKYEIPLSGYSAFEQLNRMGKLLLIFDGFDEMADRVDHQKMINNFWELARVVVPGAKVILTCRTEHFPEAKQGRALLNAELKASIANLTGEPPQFEVLKLNFFEEDQIHQVLSLRTNPSTVERIMKDKELLDLVRRPVMAELVLSALPDIDSGKPIDMSRIYLYAIQHKMKEDIKNERTFTSLADKLYFLCELSWEMLSTDQMSLNYRLFPDKLRLLFGPIVQDQKDLDHWHYDMMGQTILIRNDDGDYSPAHRSFLEFFVAFKFAAELGILAPDFTEIAKDQSHLEKEISQQEYTWSDYFQREFNEDGSIKPKPPLSRFVTEKISKLAESVGKTPITQAIWDLLKNMLDPAQQEIKELMFALIRETRGRTTEEVGLLGGNLACLLLSIDKKALKNRDLSGTNLRNLDLKFVHGEGGRIDFSRTNFQKADLKGARFRIGYLRGINFSKADFSYANLTEAKFYLLQLDSITLHPSGDQAVTGSFDGICLWDLVARKIKKRILKNNIFNVKYSPDGRFIVNTLSAGFEIRDPQTLDVLFSFKNFDRVSNTEDSHGIWPSSIAFTPDSKLLFIGCNNSVVYIWDCFQRKQIGIIRGENGYITNLSMSSDGKFLCIIGFDGLVVWDLLSESKVSKRKIKDWYKHNASFSSDNKKLITIIKENIHILNIFTLGTIDSIPAKNAGDDCINPDNSLIITSVEGGYVAFDLSTKEKVVSAQLKDL